MSEFEDTMRRFLEYFEKISNCADEDVFLKEFMVSYNLNNLSVCVFVGVRVLAAIINTCDTVERIVTRRRSN